MQSETSTTSGETQTKVPAYKRYGIEPKQVYVPADGSTNRLTVVDVETYADVDDVVVFDEVQGKERRIDAFKLAMVRYCLQK